MFSIPKTMQAVVYCGVDDLRLETLPVPRITAHDLLVKVAACGICPTDIKKIHYGTVPPPRVFGHETAGTIVRVGARVRGFRVGERVALHHHVPCLRCHACRHHAFAQCPQYKRTGITAGFEPAGGGYAQYVRVMHFVLPGVVKIPRRNTFIEGAMQEPVNTVLKAVKRLALLRGDIVLVAGQGPIGLMFTRLLRLRGINVLATDLLEPRLKLARQWGAKWAFKPAAAPLPGKDALHERGIHAASTSATTSPPGRHTPQERGIYSASISATPPPPGRHAPQERGIYSASISATPPPPGSSDANDPALASHVAHITNRRGLDAAIIAVPSDAAVLQAQQLIRGGGQTLLFAHTRRGVPTGVDLSAVCVDEKDLIGSYSSDFTLQKEVARLVFSRRLDVRNLISHEFPLSQTADAVELASHPRPESLKIVVVQ